MEAKPNMIKKYNKPAVGFIAGLLLPAITFLIYFGYSSIVSEESLALADFVQMLYEQGAIIAVFSLCVLPNLILYVIFKRLDYWYSIKGVVLSILIYTILVLVIKFM
ncbi:MAG: hypothetical protein JXR36_12445 [Bacteroidales bacterium]|nr:hypothetical protein [Bacteroidales bacterium]